MAAVAAYEADNQTDADLQAAFNRLPAGEPLDALCYHEFMEAVARSGRANLGDALFVHLPPSSELCCSPVGSC